MMYRDPAPCESAARGYFGPGITSTPCDRDHYWSLHPCGGNWLFAAGSARLLGYAANATLPVMATRDGAEPVSD